MNKSCRTACSQALGTWAAVSKTARGKGNARRFAISQGKLRRTAAAITAVLMTIGGASPAVAGTAIQTDRLDANSTTGTFPATVDQFSIAIGGGSGATATNISVAVGDASNATGQDSVAVGRRANATGDGAVIVGSDAKAVGTDSTGLGHLVSAFGNGSIAAGVSAVAGVSGTPTIANDVAIGNGANATGGNSIAQGTGAVANSAGAIAIGQTAAASGGNAVSIGVGANVTAGNSVALGANSTTTANLSAAAYNPGSMVLSGTASAANGEVSVGHTGAERRLTNLAAGSAATDAVNVSQLQSQDAKVNNIGSGTAASLGGGSMYDPVTGTVSKPTYNIGATTYNDVGSALTDLSNQTSNSVKYDDGTHTSVTLGGTGATAPVKLGNVAAGTLSATSTDAVNGAQLFTTNQQVSQNTTGIANLNTGLANGTIGLVQQDAATRTLTVGKATDGTQVDFTGTAGTRQLAGISAGKTATSAVNVSQIQPVVDALGGGAKINADGSVSGPSYTVQGNSYTTVGDALGSLDSGVTGLSNQMAVLAAGGTKYVATNSTGPAAMATGGGTVAIGGGAQAIAPNAVALGENSIADQANTVSVGASGNERRITNVAGGTQATDAVNVGQLQAVQSAGVRYDTNPDGTTNYSSVTMGNGSSAGPVSIHNVAAGTAPTDAVNVQQLNTGLGDVAKKAYAGVAAAMSLESAPYVPGKWTYAAGVGYYQNQSALGISLRKTSDNARWSVSGGISGTTYGGVAARVGVAGVIN